MSKSKKSGVTTPIVIIGDLLEVSRTYTASVSVLGKTLEESFSSSDPIPYMENLLNLKVSIPHSKNGFGPDLSRVDVANMSVAFRSATRRIGQCSRSKRYAHVCD